MKTRQIGTVWFEHYVLIEAENFDEAIKKAHEQGYTSFRGWRVYEPREEVKERTFQNEKLLVVIGDSKIRAQDIGDQNNLETIYSKGKKWLKIAQERINTEFNSEMTLGKLDDILEECQVKYHRYCAID